MEPDYSKLFHQSSKNHAKGHPPIPADSSKWPLEWSTVYYKTYERFPSIALPEAKLSADLGEAIWRRSSGRSFGPMPMTLESMSQLLKYSCGTTEVAPSGQSMRRAQASGGARYPIEIYPLVLQGSTEVPAGLYHYNVKRHSLESLWDKAFTREELREYFVYEWTADASVVFLMTAVFWRNQVKYGERGYRYILIEAGHIGQNMYLVAQALGLKCVALGGTRDEKVEELIDIDGVSESVVYAVAVGK